MFYISLFDKKSEANLREDEFKGIQLIFRQHEDPIVVNIYHQNLEYLIRKSFSVELSKE